MSERSSPGSSAPAPHAYRGNVRKYQLFYFLFDFQLWMPIWIVYLLEEQGFSFSKITLIGVPFWIIVAFGQVPAGAVADRWGRVWSLRAGALMYAAAMVSFGLAESFSLIMVSWVLWAISFTLVTGADSALLHDSLKADGREHDFEKMAGRTFAVRSVALVAATLIGAPIASATDIRVPIFLGPVASGAALLVAFTLREPPRWEHAQRLSYRRTFSTALATVRERPAVMYVLPFMAVLLAGTMTSEYLLQPFLLSHDVGVGLGFSALQVPVRVAAVLGAMGAFWWVLRVGEARALLSLPILAIVGYVGLAAINSLGAVGFFMFVGFVRAGALPLVEGYINRRVPSDQRATVLSLNHMGFALLVVPMLPLIGFTADEVSLNTTFAVAAAALAVMATLTGGLWLRAHQREGPIDHEGVASGTVVADAGSTASSAQVD